MIVRNVPIDHIHIKDELCCSFPRELPALTDSIRACGILSPPWVREENDGYTALMGYRRLHAARLCEIDTIPVIISNIDDLTALKNSISENLSHRSLHLFEQCAIVRCLQTVFNLSDTVIIQDYLSRCGLNQHRKILDTLNLLSQLSEKQKTLLFEHTIEDSKIQSLLAIDYDAWDTFIQILIALRPGLNKCNQMAETIREIAQREDMTMHQVLADSTVNDILHDNTHPSSQRLNMLRTYLEQRRNPLMSTAEQKIRNTERTLTAMPGVRLDIPYTLESSQCRIDFTFDSPEALAQKAQALQRLADDKNVSELFSILKEYTV